MKRSYRKDTLAMLGMTDVESPNNIAAAVLIWNNIHSLSYRAQRVYLECNEMKNGERSYRKDTLAMLGMTDVESPNNIAASVLIWNNIHSLSYRAQRVYLCGNPIFNLLTPNNLRLPNPKYLTAKRCLIFKWDGCKKKRGTMPLFLDILSFGRFSPVSFAPYVAALGVHTTTLLCWVCCSLRTTYCLHVRFHLNSCNHCCWFDILFHNSLLNTE